MTEFTENTRVQEVWDEFGEEGRLLFPVNMPVSGGDSLHDISNSSIYLWYSDIHPAKTVEILNYLKKE